MLIDITLPMREKLPCWPGDVPFRREVTKRIGQDGAECNLSAITCSVHFGTHVDAPYHFIPDGKTVDRLDLDLLVGRCRVIELKKQGKLIEVEDLETLVPENTKRLLVKTENSRYICEENFHEEYRAFSVEAIRWLLGRGVKLLGLDYFSIAPFREGGPVHRAFLGQGDTVALEGLDLSKVAAGEYMLICLPLKIEGASGAPARVLLSDEYIKE